MIIGRGKPKLLEKLLPHFHFIYQTLIWTALRLNPRLHGEKPASNRQNYGRIQENQFIIFLS
jgi:hypothetical protein